MYMHVYVGRHQFADFLRALLAAPYGTVSVTAATKVFPDMHRSTIKHLAGAGKVETWAYYEDDLQNATFIEIDLQGLINWNPTRRKPYTINADAPIPLLKNLLSQKL